MGKRDSKRSYVGAHVFLGWGVTALFDIHIFNLYVVSYLLMPHEKELPNPKKEKKQKYIYSCLGSMIHFITLVYYSDRILEAESLDAPQIMVSYLSFKMKQEYSEMCSFVIARMSLEIVRSALLLRGPGDK